MYHVEVNLYRFSSLPRKYAECICLVATTFALRQNTPATSAWYGFEKAENARLRDMTTLQLQYIDGNTLK